MNQVDERRGRLTLFRGVEGFAWGLTSADGRCWYWNPRTGRLADSVHPSATADEAAVGLDRAGSPLLPAATRSALCRPAFPVKRTAMSRLCVDEC